MDKIDYLEALTEYSKNPTQEVPLILEQYLNGVATNGETLFQWPLLKPLILGKLKQVIEELAKGLASETIPESPNMENISFDVMHERILDAIHRFNGAPFTIQRLCELLVDPRRHYQRSDKYLRGLEKNVLVVTTVDPFGRKVGTESGGKRLVNGLDTMASPFCPRDSNITSKLPPVPGWVTTAVSTTQIGNPVEPKEKQVMKTDEDGPSTLVTVAYEAEEGGLRRDDNNTSSSSSEELSDTNDSPDVATSVVPVNGSQSQWMSVNSMGDSKTPTSDTDPTYIGSTDISVMVSQSVSNIETESFSGDVKDTSTCMVQAKSCEQPQSCARPTSSDQQHLLNESTGFDTALKSETVEEQNDLTDDHLLNWSDSSFIGTETASVGCALPEPGNVCPTNAVIESDSVDSKISIPEAESVDSNDMRPNSESVDSNDMRPNSESVDNNDMRPKSESVDSNDMRPKSESVDSNDMRPKSESVDNNDMRLNSESVDNNDMRPNSESADNNDMRPNSESVDNNMRPKSESVDNNDMRPKSESVDNNMRPKSESVDNNDMRPKSESVDNNMRPKSESVDNNDMRPKSESVDNNDMRPNSESVDNNTVGLELKSVGSKNSISEIESTDSKNVRMEPESADSNDARLEPESADSNDARLEPESADSNDARLEPESADSNDVRLEPESADSNDVRLEPESVGDRNVAPPYKTGAAESDDKNPGIRTAVSETLHPSSSICSSSELIDPTSQCVNETSLENLEGCEDPSPLLQSSTSLPQSSTPSLQSSTNAKPPPELFLCSSLKDSDEPHRKLRKMSDGTSRPSLSSNS